MADLTPRQRRALAAPAVGVALLGLGAATWVAWGSPALGLLLGLLGLIAIAWGLVVQRRDPVLRDRSVPIWRGDGR